MYVIITNNTALPSLFSSLEEAESRLKVLPSGQIFKLDLVKTKYITDDIIATLNERFKGFCGLRAELESTNLIKIIMPHSNTDWSCTAFSAIVDIVRECPLIKVEHRQNSRHIWLRIQ